MGQIDQADRRFNLDPGDECVIYSDQEYCQFPWIF